MERDFKPPSAIHASPFSSSVIPTTFSPSLTSPLLPFIPFVMSFLGGGGRGAAPAGVNTDKIEMAITEYVTRFDHFLGAQLKFSSVG